MTGKICLRLSPLPCRDSLESVTSLYNQVEEKLHMLVMRSNESLQQLEFLFRLREMEDKIVTVLQALSFNSHQENQSNVMINNCRDVADKQMKAFFRCMNGTMSKKTSHILPNHCCIMFHYVVQAGMWLRAEGEQRLKDSYITDTLVCTEQAMQYFDQFLTKAKVFTAKCTLIWVFQSSFIFLVEAI